MKFKDFLKFCIEPELRDSNRPARVAGRPWKFQRFGMTWTAASNGRYLIAVEGDHSDDEADAEVEKRIFDVIDAAIPRSGSVSLEALKKWCRKPYSLEPIECNECFGTGLTICPHCEQEMPCDECDGEGERLECREQSWALIGEAVVDRNKLGHVLRCFNDESADVFTDSDKIRVAGPTWQVVVMGGNREHMEDVEHLPRFEAMLTHSS